MYKIKGADNNEYGPIPADQVRQWIRENRLSRVSLAENVDAPGWKPLSEFPEFAESLLAVPTPVAKASTGPVLATPVADPAAAAASLKVPAILLVVFAVLGLLMTAASPFLKKFWIDLVMQVMENMNVPMQAEQRDQMLAASKAGLGLQDYFGMVLGLVVNSVILLGGLKMMKLQSWGLALAATILFMLPCGSFCCCIGLPLGIWFIILLNKPEVKSSFR
jgi:hypothetical protein